MPVAIIVMLCIYAVLFVGYLYTTSLGESKIRGWNKILLAFSYLVIAFIGFGLYRETMSWDIILMFALLFTFVGDVVLLFALEIGAAFFSVGNILLVIYEICVLETYGIHFDSYWWFLLVWAGLNIGYALLEHFTDRFDFGKKRLKALAYLSFVSIHGCLGITMYFLIDVNWAIMLGMGSFLFMLSDYVLASYLFSVHKYSALQKLNTFLYFVGICLIALSTVKF